MAQLDIINYMGQLVTTVVGFTTLLWFVGTVVRSNTHKFVGFWNNVPAITSVVSKDYVTAVTTRSNMFSSIFGTLVSRIVDTLTAFSTIASQTLAVYTYTGAWKNRVVDFIIKSKTGVLSGSASKGNAIEDLIKSNKRTGVVKAAAKSQGKKALVTK